MFPFAENNKDRHYWTEFKQNADLAFVPDIQENGQIKQIKPYFSILAMHGIKMATLVTSKLLIKLTSLLLSVRESDYWNEL